MNSDGLCQVIPKNLSASTGSADSSLLQHFGCGCLRPSLAQCDCNLGSGCWERAVGERIRRSLREVSPGVRRCIWAQSWLAVLVHAMTCPSIVPC